jgi:hypothetical protein
MAKKFLKLFAFLSLLSLVAILLLTSVSARDKIIYSYTENTYDSPFYSKQTISEHSRLSTRSQVIDSTINIRRVKEVPVMYTSFNMDYSTHYTYKAYPGYPSSYWRSAPSYSSWDYDSDSYYNDYYYAPRFDYSSGYYNWRY